MTTTAPERPAEAPALSSSTRRPLPTWVPPALIALSLLVALGLRAVLGGGPVMTAVVAVVVFAVALGLVSRAVEGRRRAADRTVTTIVTAMFLATLVPLVSVIWTVVSRGLGRFDADFFTLTMRNVVGEGGGAQHAIVGTLIITGLATIISVPIGLMTAIYLVEYGRGKLARWVTFLVDVMTGIPSIVAGLFAYALFVLIVARASASGSAAPSRSRSS
jgi:phosphate transport system permease protein